MHIIYISGSPRQRSNTDYLLHKLLDQTGGDFVKLADYDIEPCHACWACLQEDSCVIDDDMRNTLMPKILAADALVMGTPVFFNNVTAQLKSFMDRTWSLRGALRNKIGATVVVGRRYGAEGAIRAINAFFLKHEMLVANRGISGLAFEAKTIQEDVESMEAATRLEDRLLELGAALHALRGDGA